MKFYLLALITIFSFNLNAQKVKFKTKSTTYQAIQLPSQKIDPAVKTYSSKITSNSKDLWNLGLNKTDLERNYLKLFGYQKVERKGDLMIEMEIGAFSITKEELTEKMKSVKGGKKPENLKYQYEFTYSMPITVTVYDKNGDKLFSNSDKSSGKFSSPVFKDRASAGKNKKNRYKWINKEKKNNVTNRSKAILKVLNANFGFMAKEETVSLDHPKIKKAPSFKGFDDEITEVEKLLHSIEAYIPIPEETSRKIKEMYTKWMAEADKYSASDKKQAKIKAAYLFNIMSSAFVIEDFETATKTADELIKLKRYKNSSKRVLKKITTIKEGFERSGLSSSHTVIETGELSTADSSTGDGNSAATNDQYSDHKGDEMRNKALGLHEDAKEYPATIIFQTGDTFNGIFVIDYTRYKDPVFFRGGNVNLFSEKDGVITRKTFNIKKIKSFKIGDQEYSVMRPKVTGVGIGGKGTSNVVLELYEKTDKMELYIAQPTSLKEMRELSLTGNFVMRKTGDKFQDLSSVKYLRFKKAFSKYIADCPDIAKRVKAGEFKRNRLEDLSKLLHAYTDNCK